MTIVDLNSDMGEYDDSDCLAREAELMPLITSVNIACGVHAGNRDLMRRTARLAARYGTAIGAHPGFPDTEYFGRRDRAASPDEIDSLVTSQLRTLGDVLTSEQLAMAHVKPHGALYHLAATNPAVANAVVQAVAVYDRSLLVYALAGSELVRAATTAGLSAVQEVFADRAYRSDGSLVPRSHPGAVLQTEQQVRRQLRDLLTGFVTSIDGRELPLHADTVCVHLDTPNALQFARLVRHELESAGIRITGARRT